MVLTMSIPSRDKSRYFPQISLRQRQAVSAFTLVLSAAMAAGSAHLFDEAQDARSSRRLIDIRSLQDRWVEPHVMPALRAQAVAHCEHAVAQDECYMMEEGRLTAQQIQRHAENLAVLSGLFAAASGLASWAAARRRRDDDPQDPPRRGLPAPAI